MVQLKIPDLGGVTATVIEILVQVGDHLQKDQSLLVLETDKATMEVPASSSGNVAEVFLKVGDKVSEGDLIGLLILGDVKNDSSDQQILVTTPETASHVFASKAVDPHTQKIYADVLVLGSGPGGYTAAFRASDLGKKVVIIEKHDVLGGVCLNVGCIPSKALLHSARVITEVEEMAEHGIRFGKPEINLEELRSFKDGVVGKLNKGLSGLATQRKVDVIQGEGHFIDDRHVSVMLANGTRQLVCFEHAIIAVGSSPFKIPGYPYQDPRIMDSTAALALKNIPKKLLVIGGGIIGLEMATVYRALGSEITIAELGASLIPGCDQDLVRVLHKKLIERSYRIFTSTKVESIEPQDEALWVKFSEREAEHFDAILVAAGRKPNGLNISAELAGIHVNSQGFIEVDSQCKTNVDHIYAIGDVVGHPMLAHKATYEAKIAAENIAGLKRYFDARTIPSVAYTDPEIAWMGLTEIEAKRKDIAIEVAKFPWAASGRALGNARDEGLTKLILEPSTHKILGAGIVGLNAGEILAEAVLALEMGADIHDLALSIHAHPTLSESLAFAAEIADGSITDLYIPKKK